MTDILSPPVVPEPDRSGLLSWFRRGVVSRQLVWAMVLAIVLAIGWRFYMTEGRPATQAIATGATLTLASILILMTRRILAPVLLTGAVIALIKLSSAIKLQHMSVVLHAYDFVFYIGDWNTLRYLFSQYLRYFGFLPLIFIAMALMFWLALRIDPIRIGRRSAALSAIFGVGLLAAGVIGMGERRHSQFEYEGQYISSFVLSWSETLETLWKGQLIDAAAKVIAPPFFTPNECITAQKPPHVILIHQESVVPPSLFPTLSYDRSLDPFFHAHDGKLHRLRVETYGGNSILTEFSLLTGVSTRSFGGMRQFVQTVMAGKVGDTLPQALERCGYRNVMFYPMMKNFVNTSRFFHGVGITEIFDMKDQGAKTTSERDIFYFNNALDEIGRHVASSSKPLFTFIETMSTHWPYHVPFWPEIDVPGGGVGTDPEMHEYLRRLALAKRDFDTLKNDLGRRFPGERFLIVQYGDHHPMATRTLLNFTEGTEAEDVILHPDSVGYHTFYTVNGVNFSPPALPDHPFIDVPFLGTILLESAGLPLSDAFLERRRLIDVCKGRYNDCARREEILAFHRRLIDSDLLRAR